MCGLGLCSPDEVVMAVTLLWAVLWGLLATAATQFSLPSAQLLRMAPDRPQCSPVVGDRCVVSDYAGDEYFYTVNGKMSLRVTLKLYKAFCACNSYL